MILTKRPVRSSQERFDNFHNENPEVYRLFEKFTFQAINAGRSRFGARTIMERIRWYTSVETRDSSDFKINDHWAPYYVRMFLVEFPNHAGFFEKRKAIADRRPDGQQIRN